KSIKSLPNKDSRFVMAHMYVAFAALFVGASMGLLQTLERSGTVSLPAGVGYYQILTLHGVILALVLTTFFIMGFMMSAQSKTTGGYSKGELTAAWIGFWLMVIGTVSADAMILLTEASVLYTFYAPLQAHVLFYFGLALLIVGSWIEGFVMFHRHRQFKKEHPGEKTPLLSFMGVVTMIMWNISSIGVASTVIFQLIPWSLGMVDSVNVLLSRTLFWYFVHPLVYFWLLPAYMAWYAIIPKIVGGKIFSDSLARLSFILLL